MRIEYTPDRTSRSYRAGHGLARCLNIGITVTLLAIMAKAAGAALPWWLVLAPALIPLSLAVAVFATLGLLVVLTVGGRQ